MSYPDFSIASTVSLMVAICSAAITVMFVKLITERIKKVEQKTVEIIEAHNRLHKEIATMSLRRHSQKTINYMEGDLDLVKGGKKATFKAVYHPKRITKK